MGRLTERAEYFDIQEQLPAAAGFRSIMNFACPETHEQLGAAAASNRGPALATMPLHPDPTASASCACYLINPENLTYETAWTSQEWSNPACQLELESGTASSQTHPREADAFEVLLASPGGRVYLITKSQANATLSFKEVALADEEELWSSLRGGMVAGSVRLAATAPGPRIVPVVNVEALTPPLPDSSRA